MSQYRNRRACATGHRPPKLGGYHRHNPIMERVEQETVQLIWRAYQAGYRTFISGFAQGFDQLFAELIIRLRAKYPDTGVKLWAALPCRGQETPWPSAAQRHYHDLLDQTDFSYVVHDGPYTATCMQERNIWMVDESSLVIAAWNGSAGGTANCIQYAESLHRSILYVPSIRREAPDALSSQGRTVGI